MPNWDPKNLTRHYQKRITRDKGCFEDLMGIQGRDVTQAEYEQRSQDAYNNSWGEFEAEGRDIRRQGWFPMAAYFVDGDLVVAILDLPRATFLTCFHAHFDLPHPAIAGSTIGRRMIFYQRQIRQYIRSGKLRNFKRIRGV